MLHLVVFATLVSAADPPAPTPPAPPAATTTPATTTPATTTGPADAAATPPAPAPATTDVKPVLPSPTKPRLLAMDLVDKGAGPEVTGALNQAVQNQAVQSYIAGEVVTSTQIKLVLDAASNQQMLGCESEKCMVDIGKTVEASIVLGGSVAKVGDDFLITILATNEKDGTRIAQQQRKVPANRELYYYAAKQLTSLVLTGRASDPRVPVVVKINAKDGAGTIIVDGKEVATDASTTTQQLDPGTHEIRVRKSGKAEWKSVVTVEEATPLQVQADLVDSRITLWPMAAGAGGLAIVSAGVATALWMVAQDNYDGSLGLFGKPADSYLKKTPVSSEELFAKQNTVLLFWGGLDDKKAFQPGFGQGFAVAAVVFGVVGVGLEATDLILNATAE